MPLTYGSGHMRCNLPMTSILGSYIRGIHHVTMIYILHIEVSQFSRFCVLKFVDAGHSGVKMFVVEIFVDRPLSKVHLAIFTSNVR